MVSFYQLRSLSDLHEIADLYTRIAGSRDHTVAFLELRAQQRDEGAPHFFYVIEADGRQVGLLEYGQHCLLGSETDAELYFHISAEDFDRAGVLTLLSAAERHLSELGFSEVYSFASSEVQRDLLLALDHTLRLESVESTYDLRELCDSVYPDFVDGARVVSFATLKNQFGKKVFDVLLPVIQDVMGSIPGGAEGADALTADMIRRSWSGSHFYPSGCFFLKQGDEFIGMHNIVSFVEGEVQAGVTGIFPAFRRRGHMRSLKRYGMVWAARKGFSTYRSNNEKDNPMLALNLQLGFRECSRSYELSKSI